MNHLARLRCSEKQIEYGFWPEMVDGDKRELRVTLSHGHSGRMRGCLFQPPVDLELLIYLAFSPRLLAAVGELHARALPLSARFHAAVELHAEEWLPGRSSSD